MAKTVSAGKQVGRNTIFFLLQGTLSNVVGIILYYFGTRLMTMDDFGILYLLTLIQGLTITFASLSVADSGNKYIAELSGKGNENQGTLRNSLELIPRVPTSYFRRSDE